MLGVTTNYRLHYMQENANLSEHLPEIIDFIDSSLAAGAANRVMVFCRVGQSRSASVCLAYMVIVQRVCMSDIEVMCLPSYRSHDRGQFLTSTFTLQDRKNFAARPEVIFSLGLFRALLNYLMELSD